MAGKLSSQFTVYSGLCVLVLLIGFMIGSRDVVPAHAMLQPQHAQELGSVPAVVNLREEQDVPRSFTPVIVAPAAVKALQLSPQLSLVDRYRAILVETPGPAYGKSRSHSHYRKPLAPRSCGRNGQSRRWGDASFAVQAQVVDEIVRELRAANFADTEVAFALALVRHESGFNPDAAAGYTSASGLCQMVDATRKSLAARIRVSGRDPFCPDLAVACLPEILREAQRFASRKGARYGSARYYELMYAYHHDGPSLDKGGLEIGRAEVVPKMKAMQAAISTP